jgi:OOP family OmpA-OmpF porin
MKGNSPLTRHVLIAFSLVFLASFYAPLPASAQVQALDLPVGAQLQAEKVIAIETIDFATARFNGEVVPTISPEGKSLRQAWKLGATSQTSFQILTDLRDQFLADGFEVIFQCQADACGGYDFRFQIGHFRAPDVFIDLGDFHYISLRKGPALASLLVSRSHDDAFVELLYVASPGAAVPKVVPQSSLAGAKPVKVIDQPSNAAQMTGTLAEQLDANGRTVLHGLSFATGSARLENQNVASLNDLAAYLGAHPERQVFLVGHTDAQGGLDGNIALSKKRAQAVMRSLLEHDGVKAQQVSAQGVGFLMPLASNLSKEGRDLNRRVEAVLISTK